MCATIIDKIANTEYIGFDNLYRSLCESTGSGIAGSIDDVMKIDVELKRIADIQNEKLKTLIIPIGGKAAAGTIRISPGSKHPATDTRQTHQCIHQTASQQPRGTGHKDIAAVKFVPWKCLVADSLHTIPIRFHFSHESF